MVAYEEQRNGRAYSTHISGGLYPQVKGKSYEQVKDLLARENMYGMYPSTNGSVRLSYYENDILFFMHRRTAFEKDFAEAGLRQSDMVGFVKHMANYDTFGDSRGNNVNANGAFDRQSLLARQTDYPPERWCVYVRRCGQRCDDGNKIERQDAGRQRQRYA